MGISYKKLWILLVEKDISQATFRKDLNIATGTMTKMRRNEELYNSAGTLLSKTAYKDRYILTEGSTSGQTHPEWLAVKYLETGVGTNQYSEIVTGGYAFVDLGYDKGSTMGSNFSLIGSI